MKQRIGFALLLAIWILGGFSGNAQASAVLTLHSANGDVWDLQYRLKVLNYYQQPLDGQYGPNTASSVRKFQQNYGLRVDGVTGSQTWNALRKYTVNLYEMDTMAKIIYSEARGEPYEGQVAVGAVVMNRIQSSKYPNHIHDVVFQSGAFTAVADGQFWLVPDQTAYLAALDAVRGWDPTRGAYYYFNPETSTSSWIWSRPQTVKIGNHIFAK